MNKNPKHKKLIWQIPFLIILIIGTVFVISQQRNTPYQQNKGMIFGTVYAITYQNDKDLHKDILSLLHKIDTSLSTFNSASIISKINSNQQVETDKYFDQVYESAQKIAAETNGAFDITVAPLVNAWGFGFKKDSLPDKRHVDSLRQMVGYQKVTLHNHRIIKKDPRVMLDCSSIAKGYACDVIAEMFRSKDVKNFMINIGGEIITSGISPKRIPWKIGINKPVDDPTNQNNEIQEIINARNTAMATSGNYRNFYYKNGKKFAHTIDPKSGYPIQHSLLSATVLAPTCMLADAYATAFMVLGIEEAKKLLEKHSELMALFIYCDHNGKNQVWYSPNLENKLAQP